MKNEKLKEFELLREKSDIQKLSVQMDFSKILQFYSVYMLLIVSVSLTTYISFGFGSFLFSVITFTTMLVFLMIKPYKSMKESASRVFAIGNLMHKKLGVDIRKLNREIDLMEDKINKGEVIEL